MKQEGIEKHYRNEYNSLLAVAKRNVSDNSPHVAEECVQEVYLRMIMHLERGGDIKPEDFDNYIYKSLFNVVHDSNEKERRRGMTSCPNDELNYTDVKENMAEANELSANRKLTLDLLHRAYKFSDKRKHRILYLFFVQGFTHGEIARLMEVEPKTSRNVVYNELAKFRERRDR